MSIRLLQSIFIAGVLSPVDGSTLSLSAALEADLVNQGKAVWVAAPELTASELAHASAHARMRQPNGVPIILAQSAIPMMLQSSGTMGANGALTGLTALPYSVFPQPCFMYFPAGKVFSGSPAGMYYASILTTTTAQVYNNMYPSGRPQDAIPAVPTPVVDAGPGAYTQTTAADIVLVSVNLPGGVMGLSGSLRGHQWFNTINNANNKVGKVFVGGSAVGNQIAQSIMTTVVANNVMWGWQNRNSQSSNIRATATGGVSGALGASGGSTGAADYTSVNTSVDQAITLVGNIATATDFLVFEAMTIEVLPG